jgi:hypothetical protein
MKSEWRKEKEQRHRNNVALGLFLLDCFVALVVAAQLLGIVLK